MNIFSNFHKTEYFEYHLSDFKDKQFQFFMIILVVGILIFKKNYLKMK